MTVRLEIDYDAAQMRRVLARFEALGIAAEDTLPLMRNIALEMMLALEKNFQGQGRRGGGSWKPLSAGWIDRKAKLGLDPRIGFATGRLVRSLTMPDSEGSILEVGKTLARVGSELPQADPQQRNRPFAYMLLSDREKMRALVRNHLLEAWNRAR